MSAPLVLSVPEISCGHCKQTIEAAVIGLVGVDSVEVDIAAKEVSIVGGEREAIVDAIEGVGFDVA